MAMMNINETVSHLCYTLGREHGADRNAWDC